MRREIQALRKEVGDLARLHDAGWRLRRAESLHEGLAEILSATIDMMAADKGDVQLVDADGTLHLADQLGFERDFPDYFPKLCIHDESTWARAFRSAAPILVEDTETDPSFAPYRSAARAAGYRAVVSAPLIDRYGKSLGTLSTQFRSPYRPSDAEMKRLELYRRRAADFIERFRSDEALRESNANLAAEKKASVKFYELGLKVLQAQSLSEALDTMIAGSVDQLGADMGIIQLLGSDGTLLRVAAQQGFTEEGLESFFEASSALDSSRGRALRSGAPVVVEDVDLDEAYAPFRSVARKAGFRAVISAPLVGRHGVMQGVMVLHYRSPHRPSETDLKHLELYQRRGGDFIEHFKSEESQRKSEERLATILSTLPLGVGLFDQSGRFIFRNPELQRFTNELIPSRDDPALWQAFSATGRRLEPEEYPSARALRGEVPPPADKLTTLDGEERWLRVQATPIVRNGEVVEGVVVAQDVTQRKQAELALRESEERLRLAVASSRMGMWDWDVRTGSYFWNDENYRLFGYEPRKIELNRDAWAARVHPDDLEAAELAAGIAQREHKDYFNEYRIVRPDGTVHWVRAHGRFLYHNDKPVRMIGLMEDITEHWRQIETQRVLVAELQHRTRNLMAVVQAVAHHTLESAGSLVEFEEHLDSRLEALSRVQSLLSRADNEPITLGALVAMELKALAPETHGDRISYGGPPATLRNSSVEMLSLAIHELLTNALKYGALANETGQVLIAWRIEGGPSGRQLEFEWIERGITPQLSTVDPRRVGYGRMLIEDALPYSIGATTRYDIGAERLHCTISVPLSGKSAEGIAK